MIKTHQFAVPDKERGMMAVFPMVVRQADYLLLSMLVPENIMIMILMIMMISMITLAIIIINNADHADQHDSDHHHNMIFSQADYLLLSMLVP